MLRLKKTPVRDRGLLGEILLSRRRIRSANNKSKNKASNKNSNL